ncbi:hypothetical protein RF11_12279 [Thelohanellus kitauei]|uniref:Uncharacterized protein n=1 Tax=Thelohanellus kitauei TaxID=669202 RepID=A0A0C2MVW7_THEKT|nr:hypothetical protein RF11_12279 [Thelohanellus kitauei]
MAYVSKKSGTHQIRVLKVFGEEVESFTIPNFAEEIDFSDMSFDIYTEEGIYRYSMKTKILIKVDVLKVVIILNEACKNGEILCGIDKKCLSPELICNGVNDCSDGSDEMECTKSIFLLNQ